MDIKYKPTHWEFDEIVNKNIASYWPRRNQLVGIIGAPNNSDFSKEFLFPGDSLIQLSDYRMKGFPENHFRYPKIPMAVRNHFLDRKLAELQQHSNQQTRPFFQERPDRWAYNSIDMDMEEIQHWKDIQRQNALDEEIRKKFERQKVLQLLQEEVENEREKYLAARQRLAAVEQAKQEFPVPQRSNSPTTKYQEPVHHLVSSEQYGPDAPYPLPPIRKSWHTPRDTEDFVRDAAPPIGNIGQVASQSWSSDYEYGRPSYPEYETLPTTRSNVPAQHYVESHETQTEPPAPIRVYPATTNFQNNIHNRVVPMPLDSKKRYLEELRLAAEMRRERWRREREESRKPFTDTITLLGADRPRFVPLNPSYHRFGTDVTKPGAYLTFRE